MREQAETRIQSRHVRASSDMDTRLTPSRLLAIVLTSTLALSASAQGVYRSVAADGAILFSDMPPPSNASIVAQGGTDATTSDEAVARANTQVDLAEHALALARQGLSSPSDGLRLVAARMKRGVGERVAFYQKDVQIARQQLMVLLRERQAPIKLATR
jgi:hypothetical protein